MSGYTYKHDNYSEMDDDESIYSNNRNKVINAMADEEDKHCYVRKVRNQSGKSKKILLFGSGEIGTTIRNAVTGEKYYGHKVGSKNEDLYFKARICTGEFKNTPTLFYDSAEQYEKHLGGALDQSIKEKVYLRQRLSRQALEETPKRSGQLVTVK